MKSLKRVLIASTAMIGSAVLASAALAQNAQFVFVVDESGTMAGEQGFLGTFVPQLAADLTAAGVATSQFGLVGYGGSPSDARSIPVGGANFGTAADFATATGSLLTNGGFEDGYEGIQFALDNYMFTPGPGTRRVIVLVTDEDRDIGTPGLTFSSLQTALGAQGVSLVGILDQQIESGGTPAIGATTTETFTDANNDGVPESGGAPTFTTAFVTTQADYTDLALSLPGGFVADLEFLRAGGTDAEAFAAALADLFIQQIGMVQSQYSAIAVYGTVEQIEAFARMVQSHIAMRSTGRLNGSDNRAPLSDSGAFAGANSFAAVQHSRPANPLDEVISVAGTADVLDLPEGSGSFGFGPFSVFGAVSGAFGDYDYSGPIDFESRFGVATFGIDFKATPNILVGAAISLGRGEAEGDDSLDEVDQNMVAGTLFSSLTFLDGAGYLDVSGSFAGFDVDVTTDVGGTTVTGSTDGTRVSGSAEFGYAFNFGTFSVTPAIMVSGGVTNLEGYTDSAGGVVDDLRVTQIGASPKIKFTNYFDQTWGEFFTSVEVGGQFDVIGGDDTLTVSQAGILSNLSLPDDNQAAAIVNAGVGANMDAGATLRLDYSGTFSDDEQAHAVTARVRIPLQM